MAFLFLDDGKHPHCGFVLGAFVAFPEDPAPAIARHPEDFPGTNTENYLGGKGLSACYFDAVGGCVGYSPNGGGWAIEAGLGLGGVRMGRAGRSIGTATLEMFTIRCQFSTGRVRAFRA